MSLIYFWVTNHPTLSDTKILCAHESVGQPLGQGSMKLLVSGLHGVSGTHSYISVATCQVKRGCTAPDGLTYITDGSLERGRKLGNMSVIIQPTLLYMVTGFKKQNRNAKPQDTLCCPICKALQLSNPQIPKCGERRSHLLNGRMTMSYSEGCAHKVGEFVALKKSYHSIKF